MPAPEMFLPSTVMSTAEQKFGVFEMPYLIVSRAHMKKVTESKQVQSTLFGGLPATGAIARTATNIRAGARTPVSGMIHALTLLAVLLFASPLAAAVPMTVLAGILMVVCYKMGEWHEVGELWKQGWTDRLIWAVTFLLTVVADLTVAVEAGMILAALLFIRRISVTTSVSRVTRDYVEHGRPHILQDKAIPDYVTIYRIHGPFLFGAFGAADAMYAPVVSRFETYGIEVGAESGTYMDSMMALPAWQEWCAAALKEAWVLSRNEPEWPNVPRRQ